nr:capsid protein [Astroviridae sp.]
METAPKPKRQPKKKKEKVDVNITVNDKKKKKPRRRSRVKTIIHETPTGQRVQTTRILQREIRRLQKKEKENDGPKVESVMETVITVGTINGSGNSGLTRQYKTLLNPLLLKPSDSGKTASPLSTRASQYGLYKIMSLTARVQPLVGKAIVAGSLCLLDIQQNGASAAPDNLDTIKARTFQEVPLGHQKLWRVPARVLAGPRDGWWYVDTNDDPTQSMGPALNSWFYGQTVNLLGEPGTSNNYAGSCFLLELRLKYAFSNYTPKPALSSLLKEKVENTTAANTQFMNDLDGSLLLRTTANFSRYIHRDAERNGAVGSTFWGVGSEVVNKVAPLFGAWGWLFQTGWFVIRKIFGGATLLDGTQINPLDTTYSYFKVYASAEDAAKDAPIHVQAPTSTGLPTGTYYIDQLNSANLNENSQSNPQAREQFHHDYIPGSDSPGLSYPVPTTYLYSAEEGYSKFDPPWAGSTQASEANGCVNFMGNPVVYYYGKQDTQNNLNLFYYQYTWPTTSSTTLRGQYCCLFDFGKTATVFGGYKLRDYGVMHLYGSLKDAYLTTWEKVDKEQLNRLPANPGGPRGKFVITEEFWAHSELRCYGNATGNFAQLLKKHGLDEGWITSSALTPKRFMMLFPTVYLGAIDPWSAPREPTGPDSFVILTETNMYAVYCTQKPPTQWTYWGPQYFALWKDHIGWRNENPWYTLIPDGEPPEQKSLTSEVTEVQELEEISDSEDSEIEIIRKRKRTVPK